MTRIYHITHRDNLISILEAGGLLCDKKSQNRCQVSVAHTHIKQRRAQRVVSCGNGGHLSDYVPFYFAPRSPMLYAIHKGSVSRYQSSQEQVIYLVSSVETIVQGNANFVFIDGHAEMQISQFYNLPSDLDKVDWQLMKGRYWHDTTADTDRKRRRQAEFLVHDFMPW